MSRHSWRGRALIYVFVFTILISLTQLFLSMKTAEAAYYYSALKQDLKHYGIKAEIIIQEVEQLKSVVRIHKEAVKMGMINSENPMYIDLATHQILGGGLK